MPDASGYSISERTDFDIWDAGDDDYDIPPRGWLLGNMFCRRFLSSLIADGGTGKTALRIAAHFAGNWPQFDWRAYFQAMPRAGRLIGG